MNYRAEEQRISITGLLLAIVRSWRGILAAVLVCAVLAGAFKGYRVWNSIHDSDVLGQQMEAYQTELDVYESKKAELEQTIADLDRSIANQQLYLDNSVLMRINPYDVYEASACLYVDSNYQILPELGYQNTDKTPALLSLYQSALNSSAVIDDVAKVAGMESRYLRELVSFSTVTMGGAINPILNITVRSDDAQSASTILKAIEGHLNDIHERISESAGEHTLTTVVNSSRSYVDDQLGEKQKNAIQLLSEWNNAMIEAQGELEALSEPVEPVNSATGVLGVSVKFGLLFGLLAFVLAVLVVCIAYVGTDRVYSARELRNRYCLRILGGLTLRGKMPRGLDGWIYRMEERASLEKDTAISLISENIKNYANVNGVKSILVTGDVDKQLIVAMTGQMQKCASDVRFVAGGFFLEDVEAVRAFAQCDGVILVVKCHDSRYSNVNRELDNMMDMNKQILGCVVVER